MSRARHKDNQSDVQLFPFVAVLLCTMGSLLVLLIVINQSSKARAVDEAAAAQAEARAVAAARATESAELTAAARRRIEQLARHQAEVDAVREQAAQQLRQEQRRLSHMEDHMRRLREQLEKLQLAAAELNQLEGDHIEDRKQAQAEIERLGQLIAESQQAIEQLRAEAKRSKFYAIVPFQGRRGTFRRPIYIECREHDVVLQPEGIVFTEDDFRPPIGPGNALVASLRAAREHIVQYESAGTSGDAAEPYPLIIVRPKGIAAYYCVREAIQSWDDEFGYELVEEDWELKYAPPNPQLANKEYQAAELARNRLRALAAAAPQAYGAYRSSGGFGTSSGSDDDYEVPSGSDPEMAGAGGGSARYASRLEGSSVTVVADPGSNPTSDPSATTRGSYSSPRAQAAELGSDSVDDPRSSLGGEAARGTGTGGPGTSPTDTYDRYAANQPSDAMAPGTPVSSGDQSQSPPSNTSQGVPPERNADGSSASGSYSAGENPDQELDKLARAAAAEEDGDNVKRTPVKARGKDWAIANGRPGMIPIRRTIQIVVRDDALAIMPEASSTNEASAAGQEFEFGSAPATAYDDLISAVEKRIKDWGMAGEGLYWRPMVELKVVANGDHRVNDLMRLLKFSGADVRGSDIAQQSEGSGGNASR